MICCTRKWIWVIFFAQKSWLTSVYYSRNWIFVIIYRAEVLEFSFLHKLLQFSFLHRKWISNNFLHKKWIYSCLLHNQLNLLELFTETSSLNSKSKWIYCNYLQRKVTWIADVPCFGLLFLLLLIALYCLFIYVELLCFSWFCFLVPNPYLEVLDGIFSIFSLFSYRLLLFNYFFGLICFSLYCFYTPNHCITVFGVSGYRFSFFFALFSFLYIVRLFLSQTFPILPVF